MSSSLSSLSSPDDNRTYVKRGGEEKGRKMGEDQGSYEKGYD